MFDRPRKSSSSITGLVQCHSLISRTKWWTSEYADHIMHPIRGLSPSKDENRMTFKTFSHHSILWRDVNMPALKTWWTPRFW
jgi:hypothetical protein